MGDQRVDHTAFKRISKFNDDKTEQVWELFREEFARASVAEDGETSWRCAAGIMSVDDINKQITEEDAATVISDIASSSSSSIQVTASWIENKDGKNQLTDTGVLLAKSAMYQILAKYREILLESLLVKDSEAYKIMLDLAKEDSRQAVPKFFEKMQSEHGQKARELETAYTAWKDMASTIWSSSSFARECSTRPPRRSLTSSFYDDFLKNETESCNASRSER